MSLLYVPIMGAKRGEFSALANLKSSTADQIMPLFEIPNAAEGKSIEISITSRAIDTAKVWGEREAFIDVTKWKSNARTESGIHVLEFGFSQFRESGTLVQPVVGYDRWDDPVYVQALKNIRSKYPVTFCIRLDAEALEDIGDPIYFEERVEDIMIGLDVTPANCYVLIDLADVSKSTIPDLLDRADSAIDTMRSLGFGTIIISGGSMPSSINEAISSADTVGCIPRMEIIAWKAIFADRVDRQIVFGDYVVRNPNAADGVIAPDANAKIRYTVANQFFIVRGHSKRKTRLAVQNRSLAQILVGSSHYMGPSFSWGDSQISLCSIPATKEMGSSTTWIGIDSNHHINAVVAEVYEHQTQVAALTTRTQTEPE
jgi:hypothetical protein